MFVCELMHVLKEVIYIFKTQPLPLKAISNNSVELLSKPTVMHWGFHVNYYYRQKRTCLLLIQLAVLILYYIIKNIIL